MECVVLALVVITPWPFGSVEILPRLGISAAVALILILWAIRVILRRQFEWANCPFGLCLAGIVCLSAFQLLPMPMGVMRFLSPGAAEIYQSQLPAEPEILLNETPQPARTSLSATLSPHETRGFLSDVLTLFLLYGAVRNNLAAKGPFRRLAWACLINGAALAALALGQHFSSPNNVVYWSIQTEGAVFGPFICRNHFPFYVNMCVGMGTALLLSGKSDEGLLRDSRSLWILAALALILAAEALSMSRGGLLSLVAATLICGVVMLRTGKRARLGRAAWAIPLAGALIAWFGWSPVENRLDSLGDQEKLAEEGRFPVWGNVSRIAPRFWFCGTGNGTFELVEPTTRHDTGSKGWIWDHAHNEYVEAFLEGGVIRLGLSAALIFVAVAGGFRAWRRQAGKTNGILALGGLFGIVTVAVHSIVDFGIHIPAVAILVVVIAAHMLGAADSKTTPNAFTVFRWPFAAGLAAVGGLLVWQSWCASQSADYYRIAVSIESTNLGAIEKRIAFLEAAVRYDPSSAILRYELAAGHSLASAAGERENSDRHSKEALRNLREARDLSPLLPKPQIRLGQFRDGFERADPAISYLERATRCAPTDSSIWYASGRLRLQTGDPTAAWSDWKRALTLSDQFLPEIATAAAKEIDARQMLDLLLPDRPEMIVAVAAKLYPNPSPDRKLFVERALAILSRGGDKSPSRMRLQGQLCFESGKVEDGMASYLAAIKGEPHRIEWRLEFAKALYNAGKLDEARREVRAVLAKQPENGEAKDLDDVIDRELQLR